MVEVTGQVRPDKVERVATAQTRCVPGVNALGRFGRWDFIEITDPGMPPKIMNRLPAPVFFVREAYSTPPKTRAIARVSSVTSAE